MKGDWTADKSVHFVSVFFFLLFYSNPSYNA